MFNSIFNEELKCNKNILFFGFDTCLLEQYIFSFIPNLLITFEIKLFLLKFTRSLIMHNNLLLR